MNLKLLKQQNFFLLWQGSLVSFIGSQLHLIASLSWLKSNSQYSSLIPIYLISASLPIAFVAILGGAIVDRKSCRGIVIISDAISGLLAIILGVFFLLSSFIPDIYLLYALFFTTTGISLCQSLHKPATLKLVKITVPKDELCDGHSWYEFANRCSAPVGHAIGGFLIPIVGAGVLYCVNGISFVCSCLSESKIDKNIEGKKKLDSGKEKLRWKDILNTLHYIFKPSNKLNIRPIIILVLILNILLAPIPALVPFLAVDILRLSVNWIGYLFFILGMGLLFGVIFAPKLYEKKLLNMRAKDIQIIVLALAFISIYLGNSLQFIGLGLFFIGLIASSLSIHLTTKLQEIVPVEELGSVMGFIVSMAYICTPLSLLGLGITLEFVEPVKLKYFFLLSGSFFLIYSLIIKSKNFMYILKRKKNVHY